MKISISPLDTNQSSICNFEICKKQGNLASCSEVTLEYQLDIELTKCECLFGSNSEYKLELNIPNEKFTNCFHINYDQIKNLKQGKNTYSIKVSFTPEGNNLNTIEKVEYYISLKKSNKVIYQSALYEIALNGTSHCETCKTNSINSICQLSLTSNSIEYSDYTYKNKSYRIATININPQSSRLSISQIKLAITIKNGVNLIPFRLDGNIEKDFGRFLINTNTQRSIPIFIDMTCIQYPSSVQDCIDIEYNFEYAACDKIPVISVQKAITVPIVPATTFTKLQIRKIETNDEGLEIKEELIANSNNYMLPIRLLNDAGGFIRKQIEIRNLASKVHDFVNGSLRIRNVTAKLDIPDDELKRIEGNPIWDKSDVEEIHINPGEAKLYNLDFNFDEIKNISIKQNTRHIVWRLSFQFEYCEDRVEDYTDNNGYQRTRLADPYWLPYKTSIETEIYRKEPLEWYSADFGTSAVVACRKMRINGQSQTQLIDLKQKKNRLLMESFPDEDVKREDNSETTDHLINSMLYLNPTARFDIHTTQLEPKDFRTLALWFSPSSGMVDERYRLPCLKNMMGHTGIPRISLSLSQSISETILQTRVNDIMKYAYNQLFNYYLNSEEQIETLILTVPNTFTPIHLEQLKKIVMNNLETIHEDKLEFVSESDSVLCSYVSARRRLLNGEKRTEQVLVYDMGAGTLDLTYAKCKFDNDGCSIDIIRKIGVNKAGNYIDYLLGEIILDIITEKDKKWGSRFAKLLDLDPTRNQDYKSRKNLKDYLRNTVKIMLNNDGNDTLPVTKLQENSPACNVLEEITINQILEHKLFKQYIDSCTRKVITDLFDGINPSVDVVLLSGRTIAIDAIRNNLQQVLSTFSESQPEFSNMDEGTGYSLKTIVAKGALDYMNMLHYDSRFRLNRNRLYGAYGILTMSDGIARNWYPLLYNTSADESSINDCSELNNTITLQRNDLDTCDTLCLCHSYCSDTLEDARNGDYDSISIIHRWDIPIGNTLERLCVELTLTDYNSIRYRIGGIEFMDLYPRDDYNNKALRKSLWPVIYF